MQVSLLQKRIARILLGEERPCESVSDPSAFLHDIAEMPSNVETAFPDDDVFPIFAFLLFLALLRLNVQPTS